MQPVYVQGTGSASYPVLRSVLTAFGDKVGFAPTLEESLRQLVADDGSATTPQTPPASDDGSQSGATPPAASGDANARLTQAINDAAQAMRDADSAMSKSDWTAFGQAQTRLRDALARAEAAQQELGTATPTPTPSPSPSATSGAQSGS